MPVRIGPEICQDFEQAITREWLVTNGLGGYASGTVSGANSRRYHGLLVASLRPPVERMVLLAALEEWLLLPGEEPRPLSAQEYWDGTVFPDGFRVLEEVRLDGLRPVFTWTLAGRTIEKRVWMEEASNRTVISYRLLAGVPAALRIRPLFAHRDLHAQRHGQRTFDIAETGDGWMVDAESVRSFFQASPGASVESRPDWYWRTLHRAERERGLDDEEDLFTPGTVELSLEAARRVAVVAGTESLPPAWAITDSAGSAQQREQSLLDGALSDLPGQAGLATELSLAASQFRVARAPLHPEGAEQRSIIAGYHWFADWGRDTMIGLRGLTLATGRYQEARKILETFIDYLDQGMIPNTFHDQGAATEYNSMDATLWLFQAVHWYLAYSGDWNFVLEYLPRFEGVVGWHIAGTRHNIQMDPSDGLLAGGADGVQLTWMDAKVSDWVVTPRRGKPVEVNALWYNALTLLADWRKRAGLASDELARMAQQARESALRRYWYPAGGYLYDVLDGPEGDDASLRPNQLMALSLVHPLFEGSQARAVLEVVTTELLTPFGLRTLSPKDPRYQSSFGGDQPSRDAAYHMGIAWPWLLGPYLDAVERVNGDSLQAQRVLRPFLDHLSEAGLGTIGEIFEPEPPYRSVGCIAQAWSVAEVLRHAIEHKP